jgi:hypothetical protein
MTLRGTPFNRRIRKLSMRCPTSPSSAVQCSTRRGAAEAVMLVAPIFGRSLRKLGVSRAAALCYSPAARQARPTAGPPAGADPFTSLRPRGGRSTARQSRQAIDGPDPGRCPSSRGVRLPETILRGHGQQPRRTRRWSARAATRTARPGTGALRGAAAREVATMTTANVDIPVPTSAGSPPRSACVSCGRRRTTRHGPHEKNAHQRNPAGRAARCDR